jgi:hypothetical protein
MELDVFTVSPEPPEALAGTATTGRSALLMLCPCKVRGFEMTTCSGYTPGQTRMTPPGGIALTAADMVEK